MRSPGELAGDVRVEQVQLEPADRDAPDLRLDGAARVLDADRQRPAAGLAHQLDRHVEQIVLGVVLLLPAVDVQILAEVALLVHQADADERNAEIRGALEMIARENAQAARVDRQTLVQAELRTEVGDDRIGLSAADLLEPGRRLEIRSSGFRDAGAARCRKLSFCDRASSRDCETVPSSFTGLWPHAAHRAGIDPLEQLDELRTPGPVQVPGQRHPTPFSDSGNAGKTVKLRTLGI